MSSRVEVCPSVKRRDERARSSSAPIASSTCDGWATPAEYPELAAQVAGVGGAIAERGGGGRLHFVSGGVVLDREAFTDIAVAQQPRVMEAIALHELAHVVGLAHVSEPMELMFTDNTGQITFGPGDLEGLARLGSLPCG